MASSAWSLLILFLGDLSLVSWPLGISPVLKFTSRRLNTGCSAC